MATIRCPECNRALSLPEGREVELVRCPLCRHAFAAPAVPTERAPVNSPEPEAPSEEEARPRRLGPTKEGQFPPPPGGELRKHMKSAGAWMKGMGWAGLLAILPCCGLQLSLIGIEPSAVRGFLYWSTLAVVLGGILAGAWAFQKQRGYPLAVAGVVGALLLTSGLLLLLLFLALFVVFGHAPYSSDAFMLTCYGGVGALPVVVCGLVGGIKGLRLLLRPEVRELFTRRE